MTKIFDYCENTSLLFIQQPYNALSSFGFLLVAYLLYRRFHSTDLYQQKNFRNLICLSAIIALGSFIWHTHLAIFTFALDVIPIFLFLILYQWAWYGRYTVLLNHQRAALIFVMLLVMGSFTQVYESYFLQRANAFIPVALWLLWTAQWVKKREPYLARCQIIAAILIIAAIVMRSIDVPVCELAKHGTHQFWHLLCAAGLYMSLHGWRRNESMKSGLIWRRTKRILLGVLLLLVLLIGYFLSLVLVPLPEPTGIKDRLAMFPQEGLDFKSPTTIYFNDQQVPFIEAEDDADAAYAIGLVQAHLRLGQLEMARRLVHGRLSEIAGPIANPVDHTLRVIDFPKSAKQVVANFPPETKIWVDRYVQGINDYIAHSKELPYEFRLLNMKVEKWQPEDLIAIARLAGTDYTWLIWYTLMDYRESPEWAEIWNVMLDAGSGHTYEGGARNSTTRELNRKSFQLPAPNKRLGLMLDLMMSYAKLGSNSVVVGPGRSASGAPLIANDPHLGLNLPNLWMVAGIKSPSIHAVGMMAPGLPMLAFGRNEHIAWGGTNLHAANSDLYDVSKLPEKDFTWHEESLKTRFWFDGTARYRTTKYGPVITDAPLIPNAGNRTLALKWIGHGTSDEITAMLRVNQASNWEEFQAAFDNFAAPAQNFLYADTEGNIGRLTATMVPQRRNERPKDIFADREKFDKSWGRIINHNGLPSQFIPREGYLVSANDPTPPSNVLVGYFFSPPDRAERLKQIIEHTKLHDVESMMQLQKDVFSSTSLILRDVLLKKMESLGVRDGETVRLMREWDGNYRSDSRGALAYQAFLSGYARALYGALHANDELNAIERSAYFEDFLVQKTETAKDKTVAAAFRKGLVRAEELLEKYAVWGDVHRLHIKHMLSNIPVLGKRYVFDDLPTSGSRETVMKRAHGLIGDEPQGAYYGAQSRQVSDLADPNANYFVILGGQDGWLNSENFLDQATLWQRGEYMKIPLEMDLVRMSFKHKLEFND